MFLGIRLKFKYMGNILIIRCEFGNFGLKQIYLSRDRN